MGFFNLFKSKQKKEIKSIQDKIFAQAFPGGHDQANIDINELRNLLVNKYSREQVSVLYYHVTFLFVISQDKTKERILKSTQIKMGKQITEEDILTVYEYAKNKILSRYLGIVDKDIVEDISNGIFGGNEGCSSDKIPGGYGEYGLSPTNPVPTKGTMGSSLYLERLRMSEINGEIQWRRTGVYSVDNIENMIDEYKTFDSSGRCLATVYISPYHKKNSDKAPKNFDLL